MIFSVIKQIEKMPGQEWCRRSKNGRAMDSERQPEDHGKTRAGVAGDGRIDHVPEPGPRGDRPPGPVGGPGLGPPGFHPDDGRPAAHQNDGTPRRDVRRPYGDVEQPEQIGGQEPRDATRRHTTGRGRAEQSGARHGEAARHDKAGQRHGGCGTEGGRQRAADRAQQKALAPVHGATQRAGLGLGPGWGRNARTALRRANG